MFGQAEDVSTLLTQRRRLGLTRFAAPAAVSMHGCHAIAHRPIGDIRAHTHHSPHTFVTGDHRQSQDANATVSINHVPVTNPDAFHLHHHLIGFWIRNMVDWWMTDEWVVPSNITKTHSRDPVGHLLPL